MVGFASCRPADALVFVLIKFVSVDNWTVITKTEIVLSQCDKMEANANLLGVIGSFK